MSFRRIRVLLVEDRENQHVVPALLNAHSFICRKVNEPSPGKHVILCVNCPDTSQLELHIKIMEGVDDILAKLPTESKASDLECLAIIVDADNDPALRWEQVRVRLTNIGCVDVPVEMPLEGVLVHIPDGPKIGVWIMPDN